MAGFLGTLFGGAAQQEAADKNNQIYGNYQRLGSGLLQNTYTQGREDLGGALKAFDPLSSLATKYGGGTDMYLNSLGLKGPEGTAAAQAAFNAGPGYNWQFDQGMEARKRAMAGSYMGQSGNSEIDAMKFGQGLGQQAYGGWQDRLAGLDKSALAATGGAAAGQAGAYGGLANLANLYGQNQVNLLGNTTSGMANSNNMAAAGQAQGAQNAIGLGTSLLGMGMSGGSGGFGSSLFGKLFS